MLGSVQRFPMGHLFFFTPPAVLYHEEQLNETCKSFKHLFFLNLFFVFKFKLVPLGLYILFLFLFSLWCISEGNIGFGGKQYVQQFVFCFIKVHALLNLSEQSRQSVFCKYSPEQTVEEALLCATSCYQSSVTSSNSTTRSENPPFIQKKKKKKVKSELRPNAMTILLHC